MGFSFIRYYDLSLIRELINWQIGKKKGRRNKEIFTFLENCFSASISIFPAAFIAFQNEIGIGIPLLLLHGNYFRCFRFCHDNCDLTETTVRNDCVATTFIHSRLPRPIHHYFGWDLESRCAPRLFRKENRRSARCLLPLSFRREKRVCRFNCPSFFQLFLFLFFFIPPFSSQKINGRFSPTRIRPFVSFSSSFVEKTNAIRLN